MSPLTILMIENGPDDELLTPPVRKKHQLGNRILIGQDELEPLDFRFCRNACAGSDPGDLPQHV